MATEHERPLRSRDAIEGEDIARANEPAERSAPAGSDPSTDRAARTRQELDPRRRQERALR